MGGAAGGVVDQGQRNRLRNRANKFVWDTRKQIILYCPYSFVWDVADLHTYLRQVKSRLETKDWIIFAVCVSHADRYNWRNCDSWQ